METQYLAWDGEYNREDIFASISSSTIEKILEKIEGKQFGNAANQIIKLLERNIGEMRNISRSTLIYYINESGQPDTRRTRDITDLTQQEKSRFEYIDDVLMYTKCKDFHIRKEDDENERFSSILLQIPESYWRDAVAFRVLKITNAIVNKEDNKPLYDRLLVRIYGERANDTL